MAAVAVAVSAPALLAGWAIAQRVGPRTAAA